MDSIRKRTTAVGVVTLIIGILLGAGIGIWSVHNTSAGNAPAEGATSPSTKVGKRDSAPDTTVTRDNEWEPFRQMERMQEQIDRVIRNATEQLRGASALQPDAGYSSQFDLHDRKDHFELRAYLPDAQASDVNVKIENDNTLRVTVSHRKQEVQKNNQGEAQVTELGQYEQVITLPEPVKSAEMKVERKGHEVVITIPKASNT